MGHAPVVAEFVHEDAGVFVVDILVHTHPTVDVGVGGPTAFNVALLKDVQNLVVGAGQGYSQFGVDRRGNGVVEGVSISVREGKIDGDLDYAWSGFLVVLPRGHSSLGDIELTIRTVKSLGFEIYGVADCTEDVVADLGGAFRTNQAA